MKWQYWHDQNGWCMTGIPLVTLPWHEDFKNTTRCEMFKTVPQLGFIVSLWDGKDNFIYFGLPPRCNVKRTIDMLRRCKGWGWFTPEFDAMLIPLLADDYDLVLTVFELTGTNSHTGEIIWHTALSEPIGFHVASEVEYFMSAIANHCETEPLISVAKHLERMLHGIIFDTALERIVSHIGDVVPPKTNDTAAMAT